MSGRLLEPQRGGGESDSAPAPALEAQAGGGGRPPVRTFDVRRGWTMK